MLGSLVLPPPTLSIWLPGLIMDRADPRHRNTVDLGQLADRHRAPNEPVLETAVVVSSNPHGGNDATPGRLRPTGRIPCRGAAGACRQGRTRAGHGTRGPP